MNFTKTTNRIEERVLRYSLPTGGLLFFRAATIITAAVLFIFALHSGVTAEATATDIVQQQSPEDMVLIHAGEFVMGNEGAYADELPLHKVRLRAYYLDAHEVTNAQFAEFVKATGYVTKAEQDGHCWAYFAGETDWQYAEGTDWRHPQGRNSTIDDKLNHPVVCVSWEDAAAYAKWAGKRLLTEAEWEYAARAGSPGHFIGLIDSSGGNHSQHLNGYQVVAGSDRSPSAKSHADGSHHGASAGENREVPIKANIWQGHWPEHNQLSDGFYYTAPVGSFAANEMGVNDMLGNVWEWTADWYDSAYYVVSPVNNPQGPAGGVNRVARGGSWFCSPNYCGAYSTHYRGASPPDHAFNNVGFRCAMDAE